jgi:hypothetical protein
VPSVSEELSILSVEKVPIGYEKCRSAARYHRRLPRSECNRSIKRTFAKRSIESCVLPSGYAEILSAVAVKIVPPSSSYNKAFFLVQNLHTYSAHCALILSQPLHGTCDTFTPMNCASDPASTAPEQMRSQRRKFPEQAQTKPRNALRPVRKHA